jgi:hypothetical protein
MPLNRAIAALPGVKTAILDPMRSGCPMEPEQLSYVTEQILDRSMFRMMNTLLPQDPE